MHWSQWWYYDEIHFSNLHSYAHNSSALPQAQVRACDTRPSPLVGGVWAQDFLQSLYKILPLETPPSDMCMFFWYRLGKSTEKSWDPVGIQTQDLPNASRMLLPLSHWTHGRGVETRIHIAALVRTQPIQVDFLSHMRFDMVIAIITTAKSLHDCS